MSVNELMTGLADSIRLKSGKSGKMSLEQMAAALMGVTVEGDIGFTTGTFTSDATGSARTIQHGLGQVPGSVILIQQAYANSSPASNSTATVYDILLSVVFGADSGYAYCYSSARRTSTSGSSTTTSNRYWSYNGTTPDAAFGTGNTTHGYQITNINETSFTTPRYIYAGKPYIWIAFRAPLA